MIECRLDIPIQTYWIAAYGSVDGKRYITVCDNIPYTPNSRRMTMSCLVHALSVRCGSNFFPVWRRFTNSCSSPLRRRGPSAASDSQSRRCWSLLLLLLPSRPPLLQGVSFPSSFLRKKDGVRKKWLACWAKSLARGRVAAPRRRRPGSPSPSSASSAPTVRINPRVVFSHRWIFVFQWYWNGRNVTLSVL